MHNKNFLQTKKLIQFTKIAKSDYLSDKVFNEWPGNKVKMREIKFLIGEVWITTSAELKK